MFHDSYQKLKSGRFLFRITKQIILSSAQKVQFFFFLLEMEIDTTNLQQRSEIIFSGRKTYTKANSYKVSKHWHKNTLLYPVTRHSSETQVSTGKINTTMEHL